ncbi:methylase, partial [bacterium]|nr:methylase [bacterium]
FLTETYISLRRLENEILKIIHGTQQFVGRGASPIKVKISQFYGIEINDFAVTVAKTALWIAESQMMKETEEIVDEDLDFLPLSTSATIVEGNALRMDWSTLEEEKNENFVYTDKLNLYRVDEKAVETAGEPEIPYGAHFKELNVAAKEVTEKIFPAKDGNKPVIYDYIIGNPPFSGYGKQTESNKLDTLHTYVDENSKPYRNAGKIDYVANWYFKATKLIQGKKTRCAFVSTNSITQGEQVASVWKPLFERYGLQINFAFRSFKWYSESTDMAHVHCVIIGFSCRGGSVEKQYWQTSCAPRIFNADGTVVEAKNINPYLMDAESVWIINRSKPVCDVPLMTTGNRPADGGHLIIEADEYEDFIKKEPAARKWIKNLTGSEEYINGRKRYCLWLVGATPAEVKGMKEVYKRVMLCREDRLNGAEDRQKLADTPALFREINNPEQYLLIPRVSSERRKYIPIGFLNSNTIPTDSATIITHAGLYEFGILTSSVHNAWMRAVCGRLESRYRYSKDIVYNNFPWCNPTEAQKAKIEKTAQTILDARAKYPDSSLADLYDETTMPPELRKAHKENDKAVMAAYGFDPKMSEAEIVAKLFRMYKKLTEKK